MLYTITNDFHNTRATIRARAFASDETFQGPEIGASVVKRVKRMLCGLHDCTCGYYPDDHRHSEYYIADLGRVGQPVYYLMREEK